MQASFSDGELNDAGLVALSESWAAGAMSRLAYLYWDRSSVTASGVASFSAAAAPQLMAMSWFSALDNHR